VVDHNYGSIAKYNSGEMPIIDDFFMPTNVKLIYASADAGTNEFIPNKLIAVCDKEAKSCLENIMTVSKNESLS